VNLDYIKDKLAHFDAKDFLLKANFYYALGAGLFLCFSIARIISLSHSIYVLKVHDVVSHTSKVKQESMEDFFVNNTLFGSYNEGTLSATANKSPEALGLTLVGIMFSANHKLSNAILQNADGKEYIVYEGEKVDDDIIVEKIEQDMVSLRYNGALERLTLPKDPLHFLSLEDFIAESSDNDDEEAAE
jgi:type II secretory pathway component PulC